jgi:hypothetical protein
MGKRLFKLNGRFFYMLFSLITGERTNIAYLIAAVTGGRRAETRPCTGGNRFVPVRIFCQTPPHFFPNGKFGGLPDSRGALGIAVIIPTLAAGTINRQRTDFPAKIRIRVKNFVVHCSFNCSYSTCNTRPFRYSPSG